MRRFFLRSLFLVAICLAVLATVFYKPDTSRSEMIEKYSAASSEFVQLNNGVNLHYQLRGPSNAPVLVFLHGSNSSHKTWDKLVERLEADYLCLVIDLPGHGLTGPSADHDYTAAALHSTLIELLEELNLKSAVWVGNSWGGWISWRMAIEHPEFVDKLVLISSSGAISDEDEKLYLGARILRTSLGRTLMPHFTPRSVIEASLKHTIENDRIIDDEMIDRYWELSRFPGNRQAAAKRAVTDREILRFNALREIDTETLIIWGQNDKVSPIAHGYAFRDMLK